MKWITGGPRPPGPKGPTPLQGVVPRSPLLRQALKRQGKGNPAAKPPKGSALGAAISIVGLFSRPKRPRAKA
jgi:hypothetical protein